MRHSKPVKGQPELERSSANAASACLYVAIFGGLGLVIAAAIPTVLGMLRLNQNKYPYEMALNIAEEYNAFLIRDLKNE